MMVRIAPIMIFAIMFVVSMMSCNSSSPNREYDAWGVSTDVEDLEQKIGEMEGTVSELEEKMEEFESEIDFLEIEKMDLEDDISFLEMEKVDLEDEVDALR